MTLKRIRVEYSKMMVEQKNTDLLALVETQQLLGEISKVNECWCLHWQEWSGIFLTSTGGSVDDAEG